jgi:enoyl-CoA hydratase/carnithine racemase
MASTAPSPVRCSPPTVPDTLVTYPAPHVLLVTLNRPDHLNAIPAPHHAAFQALWQWYDSEPSLRCAIITGTGRAFCAGADLKEWNARHRSRSNSSPPPSSSRAPATETAAAAAAPSLASHAHAGFAGLSNRTGKKPVVAAVNGLCLGGGMEMAVNCDMVLASADASFGLPEARIGVVALAGTLPRLVRTVGRQRAAEMALLGRRYGAQTMRGWGLVNAVVPKGSDVVGEAVRWAAEVAANSPDSVIVSREGLRLGWEGMGPVEATEQLGNGLFARIEAGDNMREGVRSFVERRKPRWVDSKL